MEEKILGSTDFGTSNSEAVPLLYFIEKSDEVVTQFENVPFFKKGYTFVIISVEKGIGFYFKNKAQSLTVSVLRHNIINVEKCASEKFEAVKTSYASGLLKRSQATAGAGGIIASLLIKGASKLVTGDELKSEIHIGPIYKLFYTANETVAFIKVACEKSYETEFETFLRIHWVNELKPDALEQWP